MLIVVFVINKYCDICRSEKNAQPTHTINIPIRTHPTKEIEIVNHSICNNCKTIITNKYGSIKNIGECFVASSGIYGADEGVYTPQFKPKHSYLTGYNGQIKLVRETNGSKYLAGISGSRCNDGIDTSRAIDGDPAVVVFHKDFVRAHCNDLSFSKHYNEELNNAQLFKHENEVCIRALRDIKAMEEIFVTYGDDYYKN